VGARFRAIPAEAADLGANCLVRVSLTVAVAADGAPPHFSGLSRRRVYVVMDNGGMDFEARLTSIDAAIRELLTLWREHVARRATVETEWPQTQELENELTAKQRAAEEAEATLVDKAGLAAGPNQARILLLESQLADVAADLAEHQYLVEELRQTLRFERDLRQLREAERDRIRELASYLQKSRWRRLGKAIGLVRTADWERTIEGQ